jgi:hypothetical protein
VAAGRGVIRAALLAVLLAGCTPAPVQDMADGAVTAVEHAAADVGAAVQDAAGDAGNLTTANTTPATVAVREAVQAMVPEPAPPPPPVAVVATPATPAAPAPVDPAIDLITRWEVSGRPNFERRLSGPICPGGASGPTIGIGYDLGHQTAAEIRRVWHWHPAVDRLATGSKQTGASRCKAWRAAHRDIRITWDDAIRVFTADSLPKYRGMALRALPGLAQQTPGHIGGLTSTGYRRGWSMEGERMREKRVIRSDCVPQGSADCSAGQVIAMCRLWAGTPNGKGQCNRSHDEARVIRS